MNKFILAITILGLIFWGIFIAKLVDRLPSEASTATTSKPAALPTLDDLQKWLRPQPPVPQDLRDPFRPINTPNHTPKKTSTTKTIKEVIKPIVQPDVGIDAILPGDNPVAILRYKGETAIVRVGQTVWNINVESIDKNKVTLQMDGKFFVLQK